jgi:hypothetical protein
VNKELFAHDKWYQGPDPNGPSDKTLAVLGFIAADGTPIGVYMNSFEIDSEPAAGASEEATRR